MADEAEEMYEDSYCRIHPGQSAVGICAICLQEKLGKLIFSEKQSFFPEVGSYSFSSSSSEAAVRKINGENHEVGGRGKMMSNHRSKREIGFHGTQNAVLLSRSKSVATYRKVGTIGDSNPGPSKRKGGFWSFLYFSKKRSNVNGVEEDAKSRNENGEEDGYASFGGKGGGKVMRSRSVGCSSRSFSAERFGHEVSAFGRSPIGSERKGPEKSMKVLGEEEEEEEDTDEKGSGSSSIRCGRLFVGFGGLPPSSSALISEGLKDGSARSSGCHSRSKSWGWPFASPIRAFRHSKRWSHANSNSKSSTEDPSAASPPNSAMEMDRG